MLLNQVSHVTDHVTDCPLLWGGLKLFLLQAVELLGAERIGHGYHVIGDDSVYQFAKEKGLHFEVGHYLQTSSGTMVVTGYPLN